MPEKHGYEDWTVEQLRTELINRYLLDQQTVNEIKGKLNLVNLILEQKSSNKLAHLSHLYVSPEAVENVRNCELDQYEKAKVDYVSDQKLECWESHRHSPASSIVDDSLLDSNSKDVVMSIPEYGSEEWQDFLINQLSHKEKEGNYPKCFGLRRLAQKYLGDIVESGPIQVFAPTAQDASGRATVVWRIIINWKINQPQYIDIDSYNQDRREFSDVADCWIGNTPASFAVHPSSTAATRAEGRALKKALMLNLLTAEEMSNDKSAEVIVEKQVEKLMGEKVEWSAEDSATASQKNFITKKCDSMKIELIKFINKSHYVYGEDKRYGSLDEVSRGVAAAMIEELNKYQNESSDPSESKKIPKQILKV